MRRTGASTLIGEEEVGAWAGGEVVGRVVAEAGRAGVVLEVVEGAVGVVRRNPVRTARRF